ncbi:hypothetical protein JOE11_002539 [Robbsia andropogonis]
MLTGLVAAGIVLTFAWRCAMDRELRLIRSPYVTILSGRSIASSPSD